MTTLNIEVEVNKYKTVVRAKVHQNVSIFVYNLSSGNRTKITSIGCKYCGFFLFEGGKNNFRYFHNTGKTATLVIFPVRENSKL